MKKVEFVTYYNMPGEYAGVGKEDMPIFRYIFNPFPGKPIF
jgi:hypothetical protein